MSIKAIVFDRDGTLLDLQATWGAVCFKAIEHMSDGNPDHMAAIAELSLFDLNAKRFLERSPILFQSPKDYCPDWARVTGRVYNQKYLAAFEACISRYATENVTPFADTLSTVEQLARLELTLGIATNGTEQSARDQMSSLGLDRHFSFIAGYDSGFGAKPDPGQILAFAEHAQLTCDDIAVVGDSLHDMEAARAAGAVAIAVTTGAHGFEDLQRHADQVLNSLSDLLALFQPDTLSLSAHGQS
ncbi:HAD family hydrolase [Coralliovum pocilloporae]|uniref:HAD family hydrolase n=1 Tax=Coralliovum pocilloporae TaxID=3066369 RepID=UPI003306C0FE